MASPLPPKPDLVIYHGNCPDGVAAAALFAIAYEELDVKKSFVAAKHGKYDDIPSGLTIILLDFTYPLPDMKDLLSKSTRVIVLDHHKSAESLMEIKDPKFELNLDMQRSGCQMAWDYLYPQQHPRPFYIDSIADRDLYIWKIPDSREICSALHYQEVFATLEHFIEFAKSPIDRDSLRLIGGVLEKDRARRIKNASSRGIPCILGNKYRVMAVSCDNDILSDVGNQLVEDNQNCDFSLIYRYDIKSQEWWISLRGRKGSKIILGDVCKEFDPKGGGHPLAAGFSIKSHINDILKPC
jgi:oligoribonuclease NrnB/cAMP/cGMP phosphodiesterase (DHH superfamily)